MEEKIDVKLIVKLITEFQNNLEKFNEQTLNKENILTIKHKILIYVLCGENSAYKLIKKIGIAKTNLNLVCTELIKEGYLEKEKAEFDKRIVFYILTEKGRLYIEKELQIFEKNFIEGVLIADYNYFNNKLAELYNAFK